MIEDAVWFERIANALLAVCSGLALVLGAIWGKKRSAPAAEPGRMEIAGALIDGKQANALQASIEANTAAIKQSTEVTRRALDGMDDMQRDMRDLTREMVRNAR